METLNEFFIEYGYWGMGLAAFLAGTFFPFSSEAVMAALLATTGMDVNTTIASATIGNVAGSMVNYYIGSFADAKRICKWFKLKENRLVKAQRYVERHGSWMGFFAFLPILGTAISLALGMLRANVWGVLVSTFIGKFIRYVMVAYSVAALT